MEDIAEAMSQLAKIGTELLRPEEDRDPLWRTIPIAKEIMVSKGIAVRAPWESIQVHYNITKEPKRGYFFGVFQSLQTFLP